MTVFCGIDWAESHHDVTLVDQHGSELAKLRISDDAAGYANLLALLSEHGGCAEDLIPVAIETGRGLLVACLQGSGRDVHVINPISASRYRERNTVARSTSDAVDVLMLANILRTDNAAHRPIPKDSTLVRAVTVLASAGQDAAWNRQQVAIQLRSVLREYSPAALEPFHTKHIGLASIGARTILAAAPTPRAAVKLTKARLRALLIRAGRQRNIEPWVDRRLKDAGELTPQQVSHWKAQQRSRSHCHRPRVPHHPRCEWHHAGVPRDAAREQPRVSPHLRRHERDAHSGHRPGAHRALRVPVSLR